MEPIVCGIYLITNLTNNKKYVGQSVNCYNRFKQHCVDGKNRSKNENGIDFAINAEGKENFSFEIIEECSKDMLDERERYWIAELNTHVNGGQGYNIAWGGGGVEGENHARAQFTEEEIYDIREMYNKRQKFSESL